MPALTGPGLSPSPPSMRHRATAALAALATVVLMTLVAAGVPSPAAAQGCPASGDQAIRCADVLGARVGGQPDRTTPSSTSTTEDEPERTTTTEDDEPERTTTTEDEPEPTTTEEPEPETTTTSDEDPAPATTSSSDDDDSEGGAGPLMLVLGVLLGASAGAAIGWFAGRQAPGASGATGTGAAVAGAPPAGADAAAQRATLVAAAIAAIDLAQNEGLREQLTRALEEAGVVRIAPDGEPFDANLHHAVDRLSTHDPAQHNTVLTDRPG